MLPYNDDFGDDRDLLSLIDMYFQYIKDLTDDSFKHFCFMLTEPKFDICLDWETVHRFKWEDETSSELYFPSLLYFDKMRNMGLTEDDFFFLKLLYDGQMNDILNSEKKMFHIKERMDRQITIDKNFVWRIRNFLKLVRFSRIKIVDGIYIPVRLIRGLFIGCLSDLPPLEMFIFGTKYGNDRIIRPYFKLNPVPVLTLDRERVNERDYDTLVIISEISIFSEEEVRNNKIDDYLFQKDIRYETALECVILSRKL
jgi:hypothetical protein